MNVNWEKNLLDFQYIGFINKIFNFDKTEKRFIIISKNFRINRIFKIF